MASGQSLGEIYSKKMEVIHLIYSLEKGGAEYLVVDLINEQVESGASVSLIIVNDNIDPDVRRRISDLVQVDCLGRQPGSVWGLANSGFVLARRLWRFQGAIHCHNHNLLPLIWLWRRRAIVTVHGNGLSTRHLKAFAKVVAISESVQADLKVRGQIHATLIRNGIKIASLKRRRVYSLRSGEPFRVVQIGRLDTAVKGQDLAVEAFAFMMRAGSFDPVELTFIGEGPSRKGLEALCSTLNVDAHVVFAGAMAREELAAKISGFHVCVMPSRAEGFGLAVVEALSAGLPVVCFDGQGPAEILRSLGIHTIVPAFDTEALARMLREIEARYRGAECIAPFLAGMEELKKFDVSVTARRYLAEYAGVLQ